MKLIGSHWYKFNDRGKVHIGYYVGRQRGFYCCVCGKTLNRDENAAINILNVGLSTV